ncbi:DUF6265 family protein [Aequorivita marina]|uniref:DUF6265 family protein n=1 Tax=Aequorivita marina TaxID=3073654 RepID=UPI002874B35D|nr:DUF6265 family protein [Aequorivita sp. S2608]MDS1298019.1 DUF6265 family protein [Aequorivita sp. S2608]
MKKLFILLLLPVLFYACKNNNESEASENTRLNKDYKKIAQLDWLLGTWINEAGEEFSQETWSKENDSTFTGFSFTEVEGETVFAETMALEEKGTRLILTVANANKKGSAPVTFQFKTSENDAFTFENKNHDFPKRIVYTNPKKDSLHAWIEGPVNNKSKKIDFYFSKKP